MEIMSSSALNHTNTKTCLATLTGSKVFVTFLSYTFMHSSSEHTHKQMYIFLKLFVSGDAYDSVAKLAYQALFVLSLYKPSDDKYRTFNEKVKQRAEEDFGYVYSDEEEVGNHQDMIYALKGMLPFNRSVCI